MGGHLSGRSKKRRMLRPGADPLRGIDRRAAVAQAFLRRSQQLHADLGDDVPVVLGAVVTRFCFLEGRVQAVEAAALAGQQVDLPLYLSMVQTLTRLADRLGYVRRARPVPSIREYLAAKAAERPAVESQPADPPKDAP
jgi:hypothetical protein